MKKILISYWHGQYKDLPYEHKQIKDYSARTRNKIMDTCLDKGYSVMVRPASISKGWEFDGIIIYIDKGRFGQS